MQAQPAPKAGEPSGELAAGVDAVPQRGQPRHRLQHRGQLVDREEGAGEQEQRGDDEPEQDVEAASFSCVAEKAKIGTAKARPTSTATGRQSSTHHEGNAPNGGRRRP